MENKNNIKIIKSDLTLTTDPKVWEFVKSGLDKVRSKIGNRAKWTPMHVRQSVVNNNSELWLLVDSEKAIPVGFYVLSIIIDPFINVPTTLFIWIAYGERTKLIELGMPEVIKRAKALGLETVEMISPRHGWTRRLFKLGWEPVDVIYSYKVS